MSAPALGHQQAIQAIWQQMSAADDAAFQAMAHALGCLDGLHGCRIPDDTEPFNALPSCPSVEPWLSDSERVALAVGSMRTVLLQVLRCSELRSSFVALTELHREGQGRQ